jgi:hypothetical protein
MSDTQWIEQRLREFAAGPDDSADWSDVLRRAGERLSARRFSRRRLALALVAVVVVAGSLAGFFFTRDTAGSDRPLRPVPRRPPGPDRSGRAGSRRGGYRRARRQ